MTLCITWVSALRTGRNASSPMGSINMSKANCAAQNYLPQEKKHDPVNHLGFGNSDWTKRLKSHDVYHRDQYQLRSAELPHTKRS